MSERQQQLRRRQAPHVERFAVRVGAGDLWTPTARLPTPKSKISGWDPAVTLVLGWPTVVVLAVTQIDGERRLSCPRGVLSVVVEDEDALGDPRVVEHLVDLYAALHVVPREHRRDPLRRG